MIGKLIAAYSRCESNDFFPGGCVGLVSSKSWRTQSACLQLIARSIYQIGDVWQHTRQDYTGKNAALRLQQGTTLQADEF